MKITTAIRGLLLCLALTGFSRLASAQKDSAKYTAIRNMVDSQQYIFYARDVTPLSGRQRFLTTDYTLSISKEKVISDLPYFGQAYTALMSSADAGIQFTSTQFDYREKAAKKGRWNIVIKPKDAPEVQQMDLTIFENGTASLQVSSTNKQPISFNGYIKEPKSKQ